MFLRLEGLTQKLFLLANIACALLICGWLLFGNGMTMIANWLDYDWATAELWRRATLLAFAGIYFIRVAFHLFVTERDPMNWDETVSLAIILYLFLCGLAFSGAKALAPFGLWDSIAICLYIFGSYLNTVSEVQCILWRNKPGNSEKLYTDGLYKHVRHINYTGNILLFTGFAIVTHDVFALLVPVFWTGGYITFQIPMIGGYLEQRYGQEFLRYQQRTKKLFPFIY